MNPRFQPTLNAVLNAISGLLLLLGYIKIKKRDRIKHQRLMLAALVTSALFLINYLIYHNRAGSVPYPYQDWTRPIYLAVLVPHIVLAALMVPFILAAVYFALRQDFTRHRSVARRVWPVWMFVSISGIIVYLMLYRL